MNTIGIFGILAGSAVALSLFLSSFFLIIKRKEEPHFLWIGLILLAVGLRIGKSIFYFLMNDMAPIGLSIGFLGLASIGPLTWLMVSHNQRIKNSSLVHFLFPAIGALACFLTSPSPLESLLYQSATLILLVYLIFSWSKWRKHHVQYSKWNRKVLLMVSGIWMALVYQHVTDTMMDYAIGALIASVFLYWIFFQSFQSIVVARGAVAELPDQIINQVQEAFEKERIFTQSGINLQQLSLQLDVPSYLVTRAVKRLYQRTFPESLNYFRIEEVKQMLLDPGKEHLKIESLAYEVGFASPSAFYAAFKKQTGQTPTEFQKESTLLSA